MGGVDRQIIGAPPRIIHRKKKEEGLRRIAHLIKYKYMNIRIIIVLACSVKTYSQTNQVNTLGSICMRMAAQLIPNDRRKVIISQG
jgi:hypothetical protein